MDVQVSIKQVGTENYRVYYRVFADGVELPSLVCIFASSRTAKTEDKIKTWCSENTWRLQTGTIVHADSAESEKAREA